MTGMDAKHQERAGGALPSRRKTAVNAAEANAARRIMPAPKGKRTLTHRQIEEAVRKVFALRAQPGA
jgi:hypothetical protein